MNPVQMGDDDNYRVIFLGLVDSSEDSVRAFTEKLSIRFGIPIERALRIAQNAPIVVKKGISRSKAERYEQLFTKLGGQVRIEATAASQAPQAAEPPRRVEGFETTSVENKEPAPATHDVGVSDHGGESDKDIARVYDDEIAGAYEDSFTPPTERPSQPHEVGPFRCPQCGQEQQKGAECVKCGIIFEKYERMAEAGDESEIVSSEPSDQEKAASADFEVNIEPAGFWIRVAGFVADSVLVNLLVAVLTVGFVLLVGGGLDPRRLMTISPLMYGVALFLPLAYHIYFLGKRGYTPGKGFLGLQVIRRDGTGMSYGDAAIRTFSYVVSYFPLMLGFLWIAFDRNKQGWHDKIARTQVIKAEEVSAWRKWIILVPAILLPLVGIGASVGIPVYMGYASRADVARAVSEMQTVKSHLEEHYYRYNRYPLSGEFRSFLMNSLGQIPADPFNRGRPYRYRSDGSAFTLWSVGPDRVDNAAMVSYDPLRVRGFRQDGDIVVYSDEGTGINGEFTEMTPSSL